jgi:hypothetical protein
MKQSCPIQRLLKVLLPSCLPKIRQTAKCQTAKYVGCAGRLRAISSLCSLRRRSLGFRATPHSWGRAK